MKNKIIQSIILCCTFFFIIAALPGYAQDSAKTKAQKNYQIAKKNYHTNPSEENTIWLGRRTAYLGKYKEAIEVYTKGLKSFPNSYKLYRHRGHRYISTRQYQKAIADFNKAHTLIKGKPLEIEPDGLPNAANIPLSNTHFNIYYHLGLAYYLTRDFEKAAKTYQECLKWCKNDDSRVAAIHWNYMTYRRMNKKLEAELLLVPIRQDMKIIEDHDYHLLTLMYKGLETPEELMKGGSKNQTSAPGVGSATLWYGIGNWYYYNNNKSKAKSIFKKITTSANPAAFGYIAAETDLK
jgi:tetratricopeptide (TPR) repeat protein